MIRIADILEHKGDQVLTVTADTPVARVAERMRLAQVGAFVVSRDGVHVGGSRHRARRRLCARPCTEPRSSTCRSAQ